MVNFIEFMFFILFYLFVLIQSICYGYYEIKTNDNKFGGIFTIVFSFFTIILGIFAIISA